MVSTKIPMTFPSPGPRILAAAFVVLILDVLTVVLERLPSKEKDRSIKVLALGSTGMWVAGGTSDGTIRIWNLKDALPRSKAVGMTGTLNDLRFSVADEYLAVANQDITLLKLQEGNAQRVIRDDHANYGTVRFSADGLLEGEAAGRYRRLLMLACRIMFMRC